MSRSDDLLDNNARHAASFPGERSGLPAPPARRTAVVTCMDARIDVHAMLGAAPGDVHVIRNAGGAVTDDAIRSLVVSQRLLGTTEVLVIHHTRCGMLGLSDDDLREAIEADTGLRPPWAVEGFADLDADVRQSVKRITDSPFIPHRDAVRGFVYDVDTGALREVS